MAAAAFMFGFLYLFIAGVLLLSSFAASALIIVARKQRLTLLLLVIAYQVANTYLFFFIWLTPYSFYYYLVFILLPPMLLWAGPRRKRLASGVLAFAMLMAAAPIFAYWYTNISGAHFKSRIADRAIDQAELSDCKDGHYPLVGVPSSTSGLIDLICTQYGQYIVPSPEYMWTTTIHVELSNVYVSAQLEELPYKERAAFFTDITSTDLKGDQLDSAIAQLRSEINDERTTRDVTEAMDIRVKNDKGRMATIRFLFSNGIPRYGYYCDATCKHTARFQITKRPAWYVPVYILPHAERAPYKH